MVNMVFIWDLFMMLVTVLFCYLGLLSSPQVILKHTHTPVPTYPPTYIHFGEVQSNVS